MKLLITSINQRLHFIASNLGVVCVKLLIMVRLSSYPYVFWFQYLLNIRVRIQKRVTTFDDW